MTGPAEMHLPLLGRLCCCAQRAGVAMPASWVQLEGSHAHPSRFVHRTCTCRAQQ